MKIHWRPVLAMATVIGSWMFLAPSPAHGVPRYSARYEQDCHLCHNNPAGGGMRSLYASQFLVPTEMAARWLSFEQLEGITPQVSESISLGADVRTLFVRGEEGSALTNFFQMQTDVYAYFQLDERYSLYLDYGSSGAGETFGLAHVLPLNGYLKLGRFVPAYGWKFEDHNQATRRYLGLVPPEHMDTGLELGLYPGRGVLQVSVLNGDVGRGIGDRDEGVALTGRAAYRFRLGPLGLAAGGSVLYNRLSRDERLLGGGFGYLTWGRLTYVGEADYGESPYGIPGDSWPETTTGWAASQELAWQLAQGVDVLLTHAFHDPDVDLKSGAAQRFGVGGEALIHAFLELRALANFHVFDQGSRIGSNDFAELEVVAHFLY